MNSQIIIAVALILSWASSAQADYILLLNNGRRITVQSYRYEGSVVKFRGLGGEVGIGKDQIQSIEKVSEAESSRLKSPETEAAPPPAAQKFPTQEGATTGPIEEKQLSPEEERAKEEKEYQQKLSELTDQLREIRNRYAQSTRGTTSPDPSLLTSEEEIKKLNDDATARRLDSQSNPVDPGVLKLLTPSPFSSLPPNTIESSLQQPTEAQQRDFSTPAGNEVRVTVPAQPTVESSPPAYTNRQKELSELRNQAIQLEKQRERLIEEMKQKNLSTGSLFLE
jgi:hypothetical protein